MTTPDTDRSSERSRGLMAKLKKKTKVYHSRLESLPYFETLIDHRLPLECYVNQLNALAVIHGVLENQLAASQDRRIAKIWHEDLRKLDLLQQDLAFFEPKTVADAAEPMDAAFAMTQKIRLRAIEKPSTLIGYLYVLEGSILGNQLHLGDIITNFNLTPFDGCAYYASYQDHLQQHWTRFAEKVDQIFSDTSDHDAFIDAAHEAFDALEHLYKRLYPLNLAQKSDIVARINPEAGHHPIPADTSEIEAALKASDRTWKTYGYYQQRYGERGKRFSDSDTCWLVTLSGLEPEAIQKQIDWIGRVLATRGMPTIMLETTLRVLSETLANAVPGKEAVYDKLRIAADAIGAAREQWLKQKDFEALCNEFEHAIAPELAGKYQKTGCLLVAAVIDEKNGIKGALDAIMSWLTDDERFSKHWIAAVNEMVSKTGRLVS